MSSEHGKLLSDSNGELQRGIDVVEFMCGIPHLQKGEFTQGAGPGINAYSIREPLGVVAGIPPFNFPGMIPLWMLTPAIAVGNAFILKPSERAPSAALRVVELAHEAGVPPGIVNVVHGSQEVGEAIGDHPDIKAVTFIGSTEVASSSTPAARATASACNAWAERRTTASSCPMPISTRLSRISSPGP